MLWKICNCQFELMYLSEYPTTSKLAFGAENMGLEAEEIKQRINKTISDF